MEIDVNDFLDAFFEEAEEHVAAFEHGILDLERAPTDAEVIGSVFRAAHSIKGASGTFGLTDVADFTHHLEGALDLLRSGSLHYDADLASLLLSALDVLKSLLVVARSGGDPPAAEAEVRRALERVVASAGGKGATGGTAVGSAGGGKRQVSVRIRPKPEVMARGMDPLVLIRELADAKEPGTECTIEADLSALPMLDELDPEACYLAWSVNLSTSWSNAQIEEVFAFVEDVCEIEITAKDTPAAPRPVVAAQAVVASAPTTLRVAADKLDQLLDLVGELVIAQAMIVEAVRSPEGDHALRLQDALVAMERNTRELQERVMSIRMVPLSTVFGRLPRIVHDVGLSCGKPVRVEIEGEETEIDKAMVEQLVDPLTHLVRNAVDHGLEMPEQRRAAKKPEEGEIRIRAYHESGNVVIEVKDDGGGMNTVAIREKAERMGLISSETVLTDDQIHELVFHPGFSTASSVTDVSGRGVGMDVVKRNIESLKGSVSMCSARGSGTTLKIRLPLTLAILEGFAVRVANQTFILPLTSVVESFRPTKSQVRRILGRGEVIDVRGASLPVVHLHRILGVSNAQDDPTQALVSIVEFNDQSFAVLVDEVLGQMQVVVKSLESNYQHVDALMGATILGDGRVAMILDVQALAKEVRGERNPAFFDSGNAGFQEAAWIS
ncbi:MAG: chemotaxis protein CheA [Myxococcales bacterium]|nr:chemotaxis protein CheA [Myxococcales bacterium]MCB9579266.1 chemotaxis protein CheA [Polyangiaceae bacterium]